MSKPDFSRDIDIGYPEAETVNVSVETTISSDELAVMADGIGETNHELKRIRRVSELIMGDEVEDVEQEG